MATLPPVTPGGSGSSAQVDALQAALDDLATMDPRGMVFWDDVLGELKTNPNTSIDNEGFLNSVFRPIPHGAGGFVGGISQVSLDADLGLVILPLSGTTNELTIMDSSERKVMEVPTGTVDVSFKGKVAVQESLEFNASSSLPAASVSIYSPTVDALSFVSNSIDRLRLAANGNFAIGTTNPGPGKLRVHKGTSNAADPLITLSSNVTTINQTHCEIRSDGDIVNTNTVYAGISDIKLKENIIDCSDFLDELMGVRIVNYNHKNDSNKKKLLGIIAQELEEIFPGLVGEMPDYETVPDPDWEPAKAIPEKTKEIEIAPARTEKRQVTVEGASEVKELATKLENGRYVRRVVTRSVTKKKPVYDEFEVFDEYGDLIEGALHRVPKMETVIIPAVIRRIVTAPAVPAQTEADRPKIQRLTGTTTKYIKYSIFVLMLIKGIQEMHAKNK